MIQLDFWSRTKNPTLTPSVVGMRLHPKTSTPYDSATLLLPTHDKCSDPIRQSTVPFHTKEGLRPLA